MSVLKRGGSFWTVLLGAYVAGLAGTMAQFADPPILPTLTAYFRISSATSGWFMSVYALATLVTALPAGLVIKRFGEKLMGGTGLCLLVLGEALFWFEFSAHSLTGVLVARGLQGFGFGLVAVAAPASIAAFISEKRMSLAMSIWATWVPFGSVLMFLFAPLLTHDGGIASLSIFLLTTSVVACALFWGAIPRRTKASLRLSRLPSESTPSLAVLIQASFSGRQRMIWWVASSFACFTVVFFSFNTFLTTYLTSRYALSLVFASSIAAVASVANALGNFLTHFVAKRWRRTLFLLPSLLLAASWLAFAWGDVGWSVTVILWVGFVGGFIPSLVFSAPPSLALSSSSVPLLTAVVILGENIGIVVGPVLFGAVAGKYGFERAFLVLIPFSLWMGVGLWRLYRQQNVSVSIHS